MHPLQNGSQVTERPANKPVSGLPGYFTESGENNVPSYPGADWFNHVIDEFLNALKGAGIEYDNLSDDNLSNIFKQLRSNTVRQFRFVNDALNALDLSLGDELFIFNYSSGSPLLGPLFFQVVPSGTGVSDGFNYIDTIDGKFQIKQCFDLNLSITQAGAMSTDGFDSTSNIEAMLKDGKTITIPNDKFSATKVNLNGRQNVSVVGQGGASRLKYIGGDNSSFFELGDVNIPSSRNVIKSLIVDLGHEHENVNAFDLTYFTNQSLMEDVEVYDVGNYSAAFRLSYGWFANFKRLTAIGNDKELDSIGFLLTTAEEAINGVVIENLRAHSLGVGVDVSVSARASYGCGIQNYNIERCRTAFKFRSFPSAALTQFVIGGASCYIEACDTPFDIDSDISTGVLSIRNAYVSKNSGMSYLKGKGKVEFVNCRWLKIDATEFESICVIRDCEVDELIDPNNRCIIVRSEELGVDSVTGQTQGIYDVSLFPVHKERILIPSGPQVTRISNQQTKNAPSGGYSSKLEVFAYRAIDNSPGKFCHALTHKKSNDVYGFVLLDAISSSQDGAWTVAREQDSGDIIVTSNLNGEHYIQSVWSLY
ncbi:TPA: hypothetical protein KD866_002606 [Vibrio parahaemolyticus]|nr:hypothetical protein [Vibrio parahaemolyticus]